MIPTKEIHVHGYGPMYVPTDTEAHRLDGEACINEVCGSMYEYDRAAVEDCYSMLDIGHNIGIASVWAFHWWPQMRTIYAYDPNPGCGELATKNVKQVLDGFPHRHVYIHTVAVTSLPVAMFQLDERWGCGYTDHRVVELGDRKPVGEPVQVPALHPAELPPADVVKLDAEGVEGEVFEVARANRPIAYSSETNDRVCAERDRYHVHCNVVTGLYLSFSGLIPENKTFQAHSTYFMPEGILYDIKTKRRYDVRLW